MLWRGLLLTLMVFSNPSLTPSRTQANISLPVLPMMLEPAGWPAARGRWYWEAVTNLLRTLQSPRG